MRADRDPYLVHPGLSWRDLGRSRMLRLAVDAKEWRRCGFDAESPSAARREDPLVQARESRRSPFHDDAEVGPGAHVGPFASLAPGAQIPAEYRTGAFFSADSTDPADRPPQG